MIGAGESYSLAKRKARSPRAFCFLLSAKVCPMVRRFPSAVVVNVVDGDTIDVELDLGFSIRVWERFRLARVDTPERGQPGWAQAKQFVVDIALGKRAVLDVDKVQDKYGRYVAELEVDGMNVNDALLAAGLCKPYRWWIAGLDAK